MSSTCNFFNCLPLPALVAVHLRIPSKTRSQRIIVQQAWRTLVSLRELKLEEQSSWQVEDAAVLQEAGAWQ